MQIDRFYIQGPVLFTPERFQDSRGYFTETWRQSHFDEAIGQSVSFVQHNQSYSAKRGTVRGLHYQSPPYAQGKLVRCVQGAVIDVGVDVRSGSSTYGKSLKAELSAENGCQLWIPEGFLHGFATLSDNAVVLYQTTEYYVRDHEGCVLWNDPSLAIDWGLQDSEIHLSDKDANAPHFKSWKTPFS